jgi:hypothetical protein
MQLWKVAPDPICLKCTTARVVRGSPSAQGARLSSRKKGRPPKRAPSMRYFFSAQVFVAASHTPPAFSQSAWVLASVAPANAGPVNAIVKASANAETSIFMASFSCFSPIGGATRNSVERQNVPEARHGDLRLRAMSIEPQPRRARWCVGRCHPDSRRHSRSRHIPANRDRIAVP